MPGPPGQDIAVVLEAAASASRASGWPALTSNEARSESTGKAAFASSPMKTSPPAATKLPEVYWEAAHT